MASKSTFKIKIMKSRIMFKITGTTTPEQIRQAVESGLLEVYIPAKRGQPQLFAQNIVAIDDNGLATIVHWSPSTINPEWQYVTGGIVSKGVTLQIAYSKEFISARRFYKILGLETTKPIVQVGERCHRANERQDEYGTICELRNDPRRGRSARVLWDGNPKLYAQTRANYDAPKRTWLQVKNIKLVD
jgi:hypothetical protein